MRLKLQRNWIRRLMPALTVTLVSVAQNANAATATTTLLNESWFPGETPQLIQITQEGDLTVSFLNATDQADRFEDWQELFKDGLIYKDPGHQDPVTPTELYTPSGINLFISYENITPGEYYVYSEYGLRDFKVVLSFDDPGGPMPNAFIDQSGYYKGSIPAVEFYWQGPSGDPYNYRQLTLNENYKPIKFIKQDVEVTATPSIVDGNKLRITFTPEVSPLYFKQLFAMTGTTPPEVYVPAGVVNVNVDGVWRQSQEITQTVYLDPEKTEVFLSEGDNLHPFTVVPDIWGPGGAYSYFNCEKDGLYLFTIESVPGGIIGAPMKFYYQDDAGKWVVQNYALYSYWWTGHAFGGYVELKAGTTYNIYGESGYDGTAYHNNYAQYCTLSYVESNEYPVAQILEGEILDQPLKSLSLQFRDSQTTYNLKQISSSKAPTVKLTHNDEPLTDVTATATLQSDSQTMLITFEGNGLETLGNYTLTLEGMYALFQTPNHQFQNPDWTVSFILKNEGEDPEPQLIPGTFNPESGLTFGNDEEINVSLSFNKKTIAIADETASPASFNGKDLAWGTDVTIEGNTVQFNLGIVSEPGDCILTLNEGAVKVGTYDINAGMTWNCIVAEPQIITGTFTPESGQTFGNEDAITVSVAFDDMSIEVVNPSQSPASFNGNDLSWGSQVSVVGNAIIFNLGVNQPGDYTLSLKEGVVKLDRYDINAAMTWNCTVEATTPQEPQEAIGVFNPQSGATFMVDNEVEVNVTFGNEALAVIDQTVSPASLGETPLAWNTDVNLNEEANAIVIDLGTFTEPGNYTLTLNKGAVSVGENNINAEMIWSFIVSKTTTGISFILPDADNLYRVYNLNGINVLTTDNASEVLNLPKGIYLINGSKFVVK